MVIARSLQGEERSGDVMILGSSFSFIYKLKNRNLFLVKIEIGGAGGTYGIFRALTLGLWSAELCSWTAIAELAWVKLRGEFSSVLSRLGLKWGSFMSKSWDLCDSGKKVGIEHGEIGTSQPSSAKWRSRQLAEVLLVWKEGI